TFTINGTPVADSALRFADLDGDPDADAVFDGRGGTITWDSSAAALGDLAEIPATVLLGYHAKIDPATGAGNSYENTAEATGYTLPEQLPDASDRRGERGDDASKTITATRADLTKQVRVKDRGAFGGSASA